MNYSVCLLAAGKGTRMKLPYNKVFHRLKKNKTVLDMSLSIFLRDSECKQVVLMYAKEDESYMIERYSKIHRVELHEGGMTRQESAGIGLHFVNQDYVMIHDAARPFVTKEQIEFLKNSGLEVKKVGNKQYCKNTLLCLITNEKNSERELFDIARRVELRQTAKKRWFNGNKL